MNNFLNIWTVEGIVIEPVELIQNSIGKVRRTTILNIHENIETIISVRTNSSMSSHTGFKLLEVGTIAAFTGKLVFLKSTNIYRPPFPDLLADSVRVLDIDPSYGKGILEESNLEGYEDFQNIVLPWEESEDDD